MVKRFLLVICLMIVSTAVIQAQSPEQAVKNASEKFADIKNRSFEMERMKRDANKRDAGSNSAPKFPEIKEDFEEIQKINTDVLQLNVSQSPLHYADVLKAVSEVNRRAARLKSNLFPAESKHKKTAKNTKQNSGVTPSIEILFKSLDDSINNFAHSSIFQDLNLVNSQDSLKAQNDLDTVINVSFLIKEKAETMIKNDSVK